MLPPLPDGVSIMEPIPYSTPPSQAIPEFKYVEPKKSSIFGQIFGSWGGGGEVPDSSAKLASDTVQGECKLNNGFNRFIYDMI